MNKFISVWSAWFFATMFYAYQYILRVLPNIGMPNIINDFNINVTQIGLFSGIYYIGYTLMHIPIGLLIDRFSIKKVIPICVLLTSVGLLPLLDNNNNNFIFQMNWRDRREKASSGGLTSPKPHTMTSAAAQRKKKRKKKDRNAHTHIHKKDKNFIRIIINTTQ